VVPDDDLRALPGEVLGAAEVDLLGQEKDLRDEIDELLDALVFFFERSHEWRYSTKATPDFKKEGPERAPRPLARAGQAC
jgi:hypothetical protein